MVLSGSRQTAGKPCKLLQRAQSLTHHHVLPSSRTRAAIAVACTTATAAATLNDQTTVPGFPLWRQQEAQLARTAADLVGHHTQQHWLHQKQQAPQIVAGSTTPGFTSRQPATTTSGSRFNSLMLLLRTRSAASNPALLTAAIKSCSSWQQASAVFTEHSHTFNHIHTAAFISHLPKVLPSSSRSLFSPRQQSDIKLLLQDISQLAEELLHHCSDRELANIAHGFASLGFYNRRLLQLLLCRCNMSRLKPQELSNLVWAVAKLNHDIHEGWVQEVLDLSFKHMQQGSAAAAAGAAAAMDGADPRFSRSQSGDPESGNALQQQRQQPDRHDVGFKPQEICNIAWALAVMQRRCSLHSSPPLRHRCTLVSDTWKAQLCQTVSDLITRCTAADVAMSLWALAVLGFRGTQQPWIDLMLRRSSDLIRTMQGRHIAVVLWSTSRLIRNQQQRQQHWQQQRSILTAGCEIISSVSSSSNVYLQQFAGVSFPALQQLLLREVQTRSLWQQQQQQLQQQQQQSPGTPQQQQKQKQLKLVCVVLLSCAHLRLHPPPTAMAAMLAAAAQQLQAYAAQQQQQLQSPCGPLDSSSSNTPCAWHNGAAAQQQRQQQLTVHDVVTLLYGLAKLSFHPGHHFVAVATAAAAASVQQQVIGARPVDQGQCGTAAAAAAAVGRMQGRDVATLLWSMAKLQCKPPRRFLWLMRAVSADHLHSFNSRDIAVMLWSLGQLHDAPQFKWVRRMLRHFLARLDDGVSTAPDICQVLSALPNLPSADAKNLHGILLQQIDDLLPQLAAAAAACFSECGPRELVGVIWGFARLGYCPGLAWQQQHRQRCEEVWRQGTGFSQQEQQVLEQSRALLFHLAQQQQCGVEQQQREQVAAQSTFLSLVATV